jgi:prepilin peptidase CpaA
MSAVTVLAFLSLLGAIDLLGWGDVKLIVAVTVVVPANRVIPLLVGIAMAGGLLSCLYLTVRFVLRRAARFPGNAARRVAEPDTWPLHSLVRREFSRIVHNEPMPYALAIVGGVAYGLATG